MKRFNVVNDCCGGVERDDCSIGAYLEYDELKPLLDAIAEVNTWDWDRLCDDRDLDSDYAFQDLKRMLKIYEELVK